MADGGWTLIESDPAVFSALLWELGVTGAEVEELYALDPVLLQDLKPVFAMIFLFKWVAGTGDPSKSQGTPETPSRPHYFAHQVINNACATLALLNATLNIESPDVEIGEELTNLKSFSADLDPQTKGLAITNAEKIRTVHNSFARSDPFALEESRPATEDDDSYHFIAYLPVGDTLYEFDGLKETPVSHGKIAEGMEWTALASEVIERRIGTYAAGELHFNLLAVCGDRIATLQKQLAALTSAASESQNADLQTEVDLLNEKLIQEEDKRSRWAFDNALRRHNHLGLVHQLLVGLAKQGKLEDRIVKAKESMKEKIEKRKREGKGSDDLMDMGSFD